MIGPWESLAILITGFGLKSAIDAVAEWHAERPRVATTAHDYFDPCGPLCKNRKQSEIGRRVRKVADVVVRVYGVPKRGQTWWAGGRRSTCD